MRLVGQVVYHHPSSNEVGGWQVVGWQVVAWLAGGWLLAGRWLAGWQVVGWLRGVQFRFNDILEGRTLFSTHLSFVL